MPPKVTPPSREPETLNIKAHPAKAFFVWMVTRDIDLADAILDLLDNCVDGARRIGLKTGDKPYLGYYAHVDFDERQFRISDNCGGITRETAENYAFRFGRPEGTHAPTEGTIGVYGIGMKRAILKMGVNSTVSSQTAASAFEVEITPEWLQNDKEWDLKGRVLARSGGVDGTRIFVSHLHPGVAEQFKKDHFFADEFPQIVEASLGLLLARGFEIKINGRLLTAKLPVLLWESKSSPGEPSIRPYICRGQIEDIEVFLAVGFRGQVAEDPSIPENAVGRWEMEDAGWTVACNERVVVNCDKTRLTGWETHGVPRYHSQFRGISGFVEFHCKDPKKLPMPTTKRGIDASSPAYLLIREQMIQGLKKFTAATNAWKGSEIALNEILNRAAALPITALRMKAESDLTYSKTKSHGDLEVFAPTLPPHNTKKATSRKITFTRQIAEIRAVADYIFEDKEMDPNQVGEECFERVLRQTQR